MILHMAIISYIWFENSFYFLSLFTKFCIQAFAYRLAHYPKKELVINNYLLFWVSALNDVRLSDSQICKLSEKNEVLLKWRTCEFSCVKS